MMRSFDFHSLHKKNFLESHRFLGGIRNVKPDESLKYIKPKTPEFGITRIADVTGLDRIGIPVAIAVRPSALSISVSQGKGTTIESAMMGAIMESIDCLLYTSPSPRDKRQSRMPSSA